jgi:branched-chain amino acid transport system permease protein
MISQLWVQYILSVFTEGAIFGIAALGLNVIWGWGGDFDLAYYGYVALGAYMTIVLTVGAPVPPAQYILGLQLPYPVAMVGAIAASALMGMVVGLIALRNLRGIYFSIVTLGAVYVLYVMAGQFVPLFDGYNGVYGLFNPMGDALGISFNDYQYYFLGFSLIVFALVFLFLGRISASRFGLALRSLREDERASAAFGRNIYSLKLKAYVLGAAIGGLSGSLLAAYLTAFNPSAWSPLETIILYSAVLVGGKGNIRGVVLGVVMIFMVIPEVTRFLPDVQGHPNVVPSLRLITIGLLLVLFLFFRPQGLIPERRFHYHLPHLHPEPGAGVPPDEVSVTSEPQPAVRGEAATANLLPATTARSTEPADVPDILVIEGLAKHFGGIVAVDNCSFRVSQGQVTGLIGPNGAGKSTAIDLISGFKLPDAGTVIFEGVDIQGLPPHRISRLGLIRTFQTPREWPGLTVLENVLLAKFEPDQETLLRGLIGTRRGGQSVAEADLLWAREILAEFDLSSLANELARNLSGGQKRLVEFARIRMAKPKLVILDEPMGGVNPVLGERIAKAIEGFVRAGTTVVVVEHNLPFIERVARRVVVMAQGTVIAAGPFESLRANQTVIDAYLGNEVAV